MATEDPPAGHDDRQHDLLIVLRLGVGVVRRLGQAGVRSVDVELRIA